MPLLSSQSNAANAATLSAANSYSDSKILDSIADGDATHAPSRNSVFDALVLKENTSSKGQANGYASLDASGMVPSSQLPTYIDDVLDGTYINTTTFNDLSSNPYTPVIGIIYVDTTTNLTYRWSGSIYVKLTDGGVNSFNSRMGSVLPQSGDYTTALVPDTTNKRYVTDAQQTVISNTSNINSGDETVNTLGATINGASLATPNDTDLVATVESSIIKKITWSNVKVFFKTYFDTIYTTTSSVATQITTALAPYITTSTANANYEPKNTNIQAHIIDTANPHNVTKTQVGLSNVDNTSDVNKPVSTAQQTALNLKEDLSNKQTDLTASATKYPTVNAVNTGLATKQSNTLLSEQILVGNASNVATPVSLSGDATISNAGALTLASTIVGATKGAVDKSLSVTYDAKGRLTSVTENNIQITESQVTNLTSDLATKEPTITGTTNVDFWSGAKTFINFATTVRATVLTGLNTALTGTILATDIILVAFGKIQNTLNANKKTIPITWGYLTTTTLADSTTYFLGGLQLQAPATADGSLRRLRAPLTGVCNKLYFTYQTNSPASTTGCTFRVHNVTQSTSVVVTTTQSLGNQANVLLTGFSLACNQNDEMQIQLDIPVLATNPPQTIMTGELIFENN